MNGKKTYIAAGLAFLSAAILYAQGVVAHGFNFNEFLSFINSEAVVAALAFVRHAISKK